MLNNVSYTDYAPSDLVNHVNRVLTGNVQYFPLGYCPCMSAVCDLVNACYYDMDTFDSVCYALHHDALDIACQLATVEARRNELLLALSRMDIH